MGTEFTEKRNGVRHARHLFSVSRRESAQMRYGGGDDFKREVDFGLGGVTAEAEAQAGLGFFLRESDGGEDV